MEFNKEKFDREKMDEAFDKMEGKLGKENLGTFLDVVLDLLAEGANITSAKVIKVSTVINKLSTDMAKKYAMIDEPNEEILNKILDFMNDIKNQIENFTKELEE